MKMDVSKLSISCLAKRYRLVCWNAESEDDDDDAGDDDDDDDGHGAARLRDSIVAELQIEG